MKYLSIYSRFQLFAKQNIDINIFAISKLYKYGQYKNGKRLRYFYYT